MRKKLLMLAGIILATHLSAQTNLVPVRLAIVPETAEAGAAADVLTAEFTKCEKVQLLERSEIEKVYREQGLSSGSKDYLKLGQILGADGLLLLGTTKDGTNQFLNARLIAVMPGVVLIAEPFPKPEKNLTEWSAVFTRHLEAYLPKLTVLAKDAIPISVVNLRSALQSDEGKEAERQLKLLTIQRLSREPQFFVLERERMQLLAEEKDLKLDDSAFWKGSYLLDGVVDPNGYSRETISLNARLTPPKGGTPVLLEISGARTNFAEVINKLAVKVNAALKINSAVKEWNAADEAQQFLNEAKWAMRWGLLSAAQSAVDSAWALGKRDLDCATVRVRAYMAEIAPVAFYEINFFKSDDLQWVTNSAWNSAAPGRPWGLVIGYGIWRAGYGQVDDIFAYAKNYPDVQHMDRAIHALEIYYEFSRTLEPDDLKPDSDWYRLGIEDLTKASWVLQHFHFVQSSQKLVPEQLAHLRSLARSVAEWISSCPAIRDSYSQNLIAAEPTPSLTSDIFHPFPNDIFGCKVIWGCFWQDKPEDCIALYRGLMTGPAFWKIHGRLWIRDILILPRVTGWNDEDRKRIPIIRDRFMQELNDSTNRLFQIEAKASTLTIEELKERDEQGWLTLEPTKNDMAFKEQLRFLNERQFGGKQPFDLAEAIAALQFRDYSIDQAHKIEYRLFNYRNSLVARAKDASGADKTNLLNGVALVESLQGDVKHILEAPELQKKLVAQAEANRSKLETFEQQKDYLRRNEPFAISKFASVFRNREFTKDQAEAIPPLLAAYESNRVAQVAGKSKSEQLQVNGQNAWIELYVGQKAQQILNLPSPKPTAAVGRITNPIPVQVAPPKVIPPVAVKPPEIVTNILSVNDYFKIPKDQLATRYVYNIEISSHRWSGGKLLIDLRYKGSDQEVFFEGRRAHVGDYLAAIAVFDPANKTWQVIEYPGDIEFPQKNSPNAVGSSMDYTLDSSAELFQNHLLLSFTDQIYRFDLSGRRWQTLAYPGQKRSDLFAINGHLYAANDESIMEILDLGANTRLLASTRRRPATSALDAFEHLGTGTLFCTSNHPICTMVWNRIYSWDGTAWSELWTPNAPNNRKSVLEIFEEGQLIRTSQQQDQTDLWVWSKDQPLPELWLRDNPKPQSVGYNGGSEAKHLSESPLKKSPAGDRLASATAALFKSDLYFLLDHSSATNLSGRWVPKEQDGYNAKLVCFSRGFRDPFTIPLKLALEQSQPVTRINFASPVDQPRLITDSTWMRFEGGHLYIGQSETLGIWAIPSAEVEAAIALQKQSLIAKRNKKDEAVRQLLVKHDRNHNGIIDPDEREKILDDTAFIELELDSIDANHNGLLDAEELIYFDPNKSKTLDPKGQAGIEITQHLLAERLLIRFDSNGDGWLDRQEFSSLLESTFEARVRSAPDVSSFLGANRNHIGSKEMEAFVDQMTRRGLRPQTAIPASFRQGRLDTNQPADPRQIFKMFAEYYWQSRSGSNRPPVNNQFPSGEKFAPNERQHRNDQ